MILLDHVVTGIIFVGGTPVIIGNELVRIS